MARKLAALLVGLAAAGLLVEISLRLVPTRFTDWNSTVRCRLDPELGPVLEPGQRAACNGACYRVSPLRVNSRGFRGGEWNLEAPFKIGALGDSFLEARQAPEGAHVCALLQRLLGVPVLNTGTSGFGTIQETRAFQSVLRPLRPGLVLLFFYAGNDLIDNSCGLLRRQWGVVPPTRSCAEISRGNLEVVKPLAARAGWSLALASRLTRHSELFLAFKNLLYSQNRSSVAWDAYRPPPDETWSRAWSLTE
ncbi:MAG: hypothetical protein PHF00_05830, partial [Elusimicrobia bacterium]|nr:hypothetical protein [Elusimicrobiota bacterium]